MERFAGLNFCGFKPNEVFAGKIFAVCLTFEACIIFTENFHNTLQDHEDHKSLVPSESFDICCILLHFYLIFCCLDFHDPSQQTGEVVSSHLHFLPNCILLFSVSIYYSAIIIIIILYIYHCYLYGSLQSSFVSITRYYILPGIFIMCLICIKLFY